VALLEILTVTAVGRWVHMTSVSGPFLDAYTRMILQYFHFNFIIYWVIVAAAHAARYYASASQLRAELTQAQLIALQMQLQPHFLFNALHTVAALVREGRAEQATDTVARLGDLLRRTLGDGDRYETPLADELGFVQAYLDIEQMRFSDRLAVTYDVPGEAAHAIIPRMALQPLAENAIRHGIARDPAARSVVIRARRWGDRLRLEVENDGPRWERDRDTGGSGVGLANVRARLSRLYGSAFRLDMLPGPTGGALAILEIPWRSAS
jgi:two-component system LytT family sensor kinase